MNKNQVYKLIILVLTAIGAQFAPLSSYAYECSKDGDKWVLSQNENSQDKPLFDEIAALEKVADDLRSKYYVEIYKTVTPQEFQSLRTRLQQLRSKVESRLSNVTDLGDVEFSLIQSYLNSARGALILDLSLSTANLKNIKELAKAYGLTLSLGSYQKIFNSSDRFLPGTMARTEKANVTITLSNQTILAALYRAIARNPVTLAKANKQDAMMPVLRCALNIIHIQKLAHHKMLMADPNKALSISNDTDICQGMTAGEALRIAQEGLALVEEDNYREAAIVSAPDVFSLLSEEYNQALAKEEILFLLIPNFLLRPDDLTTTLGLFDLVQAQLKTDVKKLTEHFSEKLTEFYEKNPDLKILLEAAPPEWIAEQKKSALSCGAEDKSSWVVKDLAKTGSYFFPLEILDSIDNFKVAYKHAPKADQIAIIENMIRNARINAFMQALTLAIDYTRVPSSPVTGRLTLEARKELEPLFQKAFSSPNTQSAIRRIAESMYQKMQEGSVTANQVQASAQLSKQLRIPLVTSAVEGAKKVRAIENTPDQELTFNQPAMERAIESHLFELKGIYRTWANYVLKQQSFASQLAAWDFVRSSVLKIGLDNQWQCEIPSLSRRITKWWGESENLRTKRNNHENGCATLFMMARAMGLERDERQMNIQGQKEVERPSKIKDFYPDLAKGLKLGEVDEDDFFEAYRKELRLQEFESAPILSSDPTFSRILWKRLSATENEDQQDAMVVGALKESFDILNESLKKTSQAKTLKDFDTIFLRTKTLKGFFGGDREMDEYLKDLSIDQVDPNKMDDLSMDYSIMSEFRQEHERLQEEAYRTERLQAEVISNYIHYSFLTGWVTLGAQGIRWLGGRLFMPRWTGLPAVSRGLDVVLWRANDFLLYHAQLISWAIASNIGMAEISKAGYRSEITKTGELYQTELRGMPGAVPLISFQEFLRVRRNSQMMISTLNKQELFDAAILAFPAVVSQMARKYYVHKSHLQSVRNANLSRASRADIESVERYVEVLANRQLKALSSDMKYLGTKSLSFHEVERAFEGRMKTARTEYQLMAAQEKFDRIVFEIGKEVHSIAHHGNMLQVYARYLTKNQMSGDSLLLYKRAYEKKFLSGGSL